MSDMGKKKDGDRVVFVRDVLVRLDDAQALELHNKSVKIGARADDIEDKLKEHNKTEKARIAAMRAEAARDHAGAAASEIMTPMKCYEFIEGQFALVHRADTDELVDRRKLSDAERQTSAFGGLDGGGELPLEPDESPAGDDPPPNMDAVPPKRRGKKS